jgi:hypothetical protein
MQISDIEPGKSYACYFKTAELVDERGNAVIERESQKPAKIIQREIFGIIKTRDLQQQLVEILDQETGKTYVVGWEDCWDVDEVEWHDADSKT